MKRDTVAAGTWIGIWGTVLIILLSYLEMTFGILNTPPWNIAADVFLTSANIKTLYGLIIGMAGTLALGIATTLFIAAILRLTGTDYAWLKGVIVANAIGFGTMGLFMPMLNISENIQSEPWTNILALLDLTIFGLFTGYMLKKSFQQRVEK
ncbi:hypothetical protein Tfer_0967 [Thermincola ferriacetica]|uniref:Uncharacterized protein n=2 Tax=Thermincola TaxID=278993 RepID=D5XDF3_THEPJ|nr:MULTISPECIES: hypothetical protein [Thermincola]ADG81801.1 hypothetical protein TherJR_0935 [Thermincola potens JR]KNZ70401.1 hypothetical protein Tfer_0967 [Thermincola ferriacetica]